MKHPAGFLNFLRARWVPMLAGAAIFAFLFQGAYLLSLRQQADEFQRAQLEALRSAVEDVKRNQDDNTNKTNDLIIKADKNGQALDCVLQFLGTGQSVQRSEIEDCRARSHAEQAEAQSTQQQQSTATQQQGRGQGQQSSQGNGNGNDGNGQSDEVRPALQRIIDWVL